MSSQVKILKKTDIKSNKSPWGNCVVTITPDMLKALSQGSVLHIDVMEEYSVFVSVGDKVDYKEL